MARAVSEKAGRLKQAARAAGLTADEIAERMHMSPAAIRHWWTNRNQPSIDQLEQYGQVTGVSAWWLLTGKDDPEELFRRIEAGLERFRREVAGGSWEALIGAEGDGPGPSLRERLAADAGAAWLELSDADRQAVVDHIRWVARLRRYQRTEAE